MRSVIAVVSLLAVACGGSSPTAPTSSTDPSPTAPTSPTDPSPVPSPVPPPSGPSCTPGVTALPTTVPRQGGSYTFEITIASGCGWTAQTDVAWADVAPSAGQSNASPRLSVGENLRVDGRSLFVTVGDQSFRVTQLTGCGYSLDPTSLNESADGGSARIDVVTTLGQCSWTATANESWIRVLTPSGTGSSTISLDLDANPSDERHTFLTIAGVRVDVTQRGQ